MIKSIAKIVAAYLNVEILDEAEFTKRVNEALAVFIITRLMTKQMELDGIIKKKI